MRLLMMVRNSEDREMKICNWYCRVSLNTQIILVFDTLCQKMRKCRTLLKKVLNEVLKEIIVTFAKRHFTSIYII